MTHPHFPFVQCIITPIQVEGKLKGGPVARAHHLLSMMIWHHISTINECIPKNANTSVDGTVGFAMMKKQPTKKISKKTKVSAIYWFSISNPMSLFISYRVSYWLLRVPRTRRCYWFIGAMGADLLCFFSSRNEVLRRFILIGYLGCMFLLLIGLTVFGCAMTTSCVKGDVLVDWVQGFCCVRKEGRAKGPCLHCFVAGDVNSGSAKVHLSGGHLTNFVTHERSRSLNQSLNNTPHRTLYNQTSHNYNVACVYYLLDVQSCQYILYLLAT
jgi:hypothetical protein